MPMHKTHQYHWEKTWYKLTHSGEFSAFRVIIQARLLYVISTILAASSPGLAQDCLLPLTCHPSPSLTTFAFRSREVRRLLLDLDPYGGTDPLGVFPLFLKRTANVMAPRFSVVFRRLVRLGNFPSCWRQANVTQFQKVHRPLLLQITEQFSKHQYCLRCLSAWCRFVLDNFWNAVVCF